MNFQKNILVKTQNFKNLNLKETILKIPCKGASSKIIFLEIMWQKTNKNLDKIHKEKMATIVNAKLFKNNQKKQTACKI